MIVARTLASAARSCIQRCRQSRGADLRCSCNACPDSRQVVFLYPSGQSSKAQSETYAT
jgi:hypothetical protein